MARDDSPFDPRHLYVSLSPAEVSVLAAHALLHGETPPKGCYFETWRRVQRGIADSVSFAEFGAIADALPMLLEDLRAVHTEVR